LSTTPAIGEGGALDENRLFGGGIHPNGRREGPVLDGLPERANVPWRSRVDPRALKRAGRRWTLSILAHVVPLSAAAILLGLLGPVTAVVGVILLLHAWAIPELYAARGAGVLRSRSPAGPAAERRALLLLGDLIGDEARRLHARTGLVREVGELGVWILGEAGAVLLAPGGRRVYCYCVKPTGTDLPVSDRIAHLLLALRCDERGFVTVANLAFSGATWRLRRRLGPEHREALGAARRAARASSYALGAARRAARASW
jgi:hypothetical protein